MDLKADFKKKRKDLKLSQAALGKRMGRDRNHVSNIERGLTRLSAEDYLFLDQLYKERFPSAFPVEL
jgi:transcriptional regulator with XRE-family HTH domain